MGSRTLKKLVRNLAPVLALVVLLFVSLLLINDAMKDAATFERFYLWLLLFNALGIVILAVMIAINLYRLIVQYRLRTIGSHLTARLVLVFVALSLVPVAFVYYFSLAFMHKGIDSWFDVRIERALEDSLRLGQASMDVRKRQALQRTEHMVDSLKDVPEGIVEVYLNQQREASSAMELLMLGNNNQVVAFSSDAPTAVLPDQPPERVLSSVNQGRSYVALEPLPESGLQIRVIVPITRAGPGTEIVGALQAIYPVTDRINVLAQSVQGSYEQYTELAFLRNPLKYSLTLALSTVLFLSVLSAIWVAFYAARRLVAPIRDLVEGTKAVAAGDYGKRLPLSGSDELGFLLRSFNDMTRKVAQARDIAEQSQRQEAMQRTYLETVLERISSGVLTLDEQMVLRRVNMSASHIIGVDLGARVGRSLGEIAESQPVLQQLLDQIREPLEEQQREWTREVVIFGVAGRKVLMCRGAVLPGDELQQSGFVIVFDDLTALIQAQRDSAWSEMARRLAHEIKNPLTPIQLSAERIRRKFLDRMPETDAKLLDRATRTIVHQVESMKDMVNAFSEYARAPQMHAAAMDINDLVRDVAEMYVAGRTRASLQLDLDSSAPVIEADAGRIRQLLHNLLKNAFEAIDDKGQVSIVTRCHEEPGCNFVELRVEDTGPGIPQDILDHLGEPYVTNKPKGTGLGLAIVRRIVEEHGGIVWAENQPERGAAIIIRLPMISGVDSESGKMAQAQGGGKR
jgi:nitrogen fixation/metabolism regulation signal transduction histidine kinase